MPNIEIPTEDATICNRLRDWLPKGSWRRETEAGTRIIDGCKKLIHVRPRPLTTYNSIKGKTVGELVREYRRGAWAALHYSSFTRKT